MKGEAMEALLPCPNPWCKSTEVDTAIIQRGEEPEWRVACYHCHLEGPLASFEDHAITAWNTRAPTPDPIGGVTVDTREAEVRARECLSDAMNEPCSSSLPVEATLVQEGASEHIMVFADTALLAIENAFATQPDPTAMIRRCVEAGNALNSGARPSNWTDDPGEESAWLQLDALLAEAKAWLGEGAA